MLEVVLEGQLEKETDKEQFSGLLKSICEEMKLKIEDYGSVLLIDVCPEGIVECSYEGRFISVSAQTNIVGPGFHAFVCTLFDAIIQKSQLSFEVIDSTRYYEERNFENLKYKYFYTWLEILQDYVKDNWNQVKNLCLCWAKDYYRPIGKEGHIVTPMGYMTKDKFLHSEVEDLAKEFFIWNEEKRTAQYYRNCAISLLWKECYFEYSAMNEETDKIANSILDYIEAAYEKDNLLALPMEAYDILCDAIQREKFIQHADVLAIADLGYRNHTVFYPFGNWMIPTHGCSEKSYDKNTKSLHFMAPYKTSDEPWRWMVKVDAFTLEQESASFMKKLEEPNEEDEIFEFHTKEHGLLGKGCIEKVDSYYVMTVQINSDKDIIYLQCVINDEKDIEPLKKWCTEIEYVQYEQNKLHS